MDTFGHLLVTFPVNSSAAAVLVSSRRSGTSCINSEVERQVLADAVTMLDEY